MVFFHFYLRLEKNDSWYLLQTNYDNWKKPLFIDDRRTPVYYLFIFGVLCQMIGYTNSM